MFKLYFFFCVLSLINYSIAQSVPQESKDFDSLKRRVKELEDIQAENSEMIKRQLADQHFDQNSRGFIEVKAGLSSFEPKDVEDDNDEVFNDLDDSQWEKFGHALILDLEVGKTILNTNSTKDEFGIGYQHFRSQMDGSFTSSSSGNKVKVFEKVSIHTLFARYSKLFKVDKEGRLYIGPGVTVGYSPVTKMMIELESGNEGAQISAEEDSYLFEFYGKAKYEFSRYFSFVFNAGYRMQEAENLRLNAAELVTVKTKTDLDASGIFAFGGISVAF
jgi:hypothetical protein